MKRSIYFRSFVCCCWLTSIVSGVSPLFSNRIQSDALVQFLFNEGQEQLIAPDSVLTKTASSTVSSAEFGNFEFSSSTSWIPESIGVRFGPETDGDFIKSNGTAKALGDLLTEDFSVEIWFKSSSSGDNTYNSIAPIVQFGGATLNLPDNRNNTSECAGGIGNLVITEEGVSLGDSEHGCTTHKVDSPKDITHLVIAYNKRSSRSTVYLNGYNASSIGMPDLNPSLWPQSSVELAPLFKYEDNDSTKTDSWEGSIYLFAVHGVALTADEVLYNFEAFLPNSPPHLPSTTLCVMNNTFVEFELEYFDFDMEYKDQFTSITDNITVELFFDMDAPLLGTLYFNSTDSAPLVDGDVLRLPFTLLYEPRPYMYDWGGEVTSFQLKITDGKDVNKATTINVHIIPKNKPPTTVDSEIEVNFNIPTEITLTGTDVFPSDTIAHSECFTLTSPTRPGPHGEIKNANVASLPGYGSLFFSADKVTEDVEAINRSGVEIPKVNETFQLVYLLQEDLSKDLSLYSHLTGLELLFSTFFYYSLEDDGGSTSHWGTVNIHILNPLSTRPHQTLPVLEHSSVTFEFEGTSLIGEDRGYLVYIYSLPSEGYLKIDGDYYLNIEEKGYPHTSNFMYIHSNPIKLPDSPHPHFFYAIADPSEPRFRSPQGSVIFEVEHVNDLIVIAVNTTNSKDKRIQIPHHSDVSAEFYSGATRLCISLLDTDGVEFRVKVVFESNDGVRIQLSEQALATVQSSAHFLMLDEVELGDGLLGFVATFTETNLLLDGIALAGPSTKGDQILTISVTDRIDHDYQPTAASVTAFETIFLTTKSPPQSARSNADIIINVIIASFSVVCLALVILIVSMLFRAFTTSEQQPTSKGRKASIFSRRGSVFSQLPTEDPPVNAAEVELVTASLDTNTDLESGCKPNTQSDVVDTNTDVATNSTSSVNINRDIKTKIDPKNSSSASPLTEKASSLGNDDDDSFDGMEISQSLLQGVDPEALPSSNYY